MNKWETEPDRKFWHSQGLDCLIVRNHAGALCGYVGVPKSHKYFGKSYDKVQPEVSGCVHGGLTFSDKCTGHICHTDKEALHKEVWWLGFDCSHAGDLTPNQFPSFDDDVYRDMEYVIENVERLAKELAS